MMRYQLDFNMRPLLIFQASKLVWPATSTSEMCACCKCHEGESEKVILLEPFACLIVGILQNIFGLGARFHNSQLKHIDTECSFCDLQVHCLMYVWEKEKDNNENQTRINTMNRPSPQMSLGFLGSWAMPHTHTHSYVAVWYEKCECWTAFFLYLCQWSHLCCWAITIVSRLRNSCLMTGCHPAIENIGGCAILGLNYDNKTNAMPNRQAIHKRDHLEEKSTHHRCKMRKHRLRFRSLEFCSAVAFCQCRKSFTKSRTDPS